jgi:hypothetical protein
LGLELALNAKWAYVRAQNSLPLAAAA